MQTIDHSVIERLQAAARRGRSRQMACLFQQLILWIRSRLPGADPALRDLACC
jgi:hypothetical protein